MPWVESVAKVKARVCCGTFLEVWSPEAPLEVGFDADGFGVEQVAEGNLMNQDGEEDPLQSDIELPEACEQDNDDDVVAGPVCDDHGSVSSRSTRGRASPRQRSSSSSSNSSTSSREGGSPQCSNSSHSTASNNPPQPVRADGPVRDASEQHVAVEANEGAGGSRQRRPDSFSWGHFLFTRRTSPPGWQVLCKYHRDAAAACTKTCTCSDNEAGPVIRRMKSWALTAGAHASKRSHQGSRGLPAEADAHKRLSDAEMDALVADMPPP